MTHPRPFVPRPVAAATARFWALGSRLRRGRRSLHTIGDAYEARFVVAARPASVGAPLLDQPGTHRAVVRFSRGAGLPEPLPDILGIAVRVCDAHGPAAHQDFLLASSSDLPVAHHALVPTRSFFGRAFSSVLPYAIGDRVQLVGATPAAGRPRGASGGLDAVAAAAARGDLAYDVAVARPFGRFRAVARLEVGSRLPAEESERLRFNPWNSGGGIRPAGPFQGLRRPAYEGSQRGRRT